MPDSKAPDIEETDPKVKLDIVGMYANDESAGLKVLREFFLEFDEEVVVDQSVAVNAAVQGVMDTPDLEGVVLANVLLDKELLKKVIKSNPLFANVGMETKERIFASAELRNFAKDDMVVGPESKDQGMFIPIKRTDVDILDKDGNKVKSKVLQPGTYVGEYSMVGLQPTATIVNKSDGSKFVFISNELFEKLHVASRLEMFEELLRNSPLVKYTQEDSIDAKSDSVSISMPRSDVAVLFPKLLLKPSKYEAFKSFEVIKYDVGEEISPPDKNYLGLIGEDGLVSVNRVNKSGESVKIAEIQHFNTLFEANAVGVAPHSSVKIIAEKPTSVLYLNVAKDSPNYEKCIEAAVRGQAAKLGGANTRAAKANA